MSITLACEPPGAMTDEKKDRFKRIDALEDKVDNLRKKKKEEYTGRRND